MHSNLNCILILFNICVYRKSELLRSAPIVKSSSDQQPFSRCSELAKNTDISEGSTNTDEYITCAEASKRGINPATASSSSTTHVPGSNLTFIVRSMLLL